MHEEYVNWLSKLVTSEKLARAALSSREDIVGRYPPMLRQAAFASAHF